MLRSAWRPSGIRGTPGQGVKTTATHRSTTMRILAAAFLGLLVSANVAPAGNPGFGLVPQPVELKATAGR